MISQNLLKRYIRQQGVFIYHLTGSENLDSIFEQGLIPQGAESQFSRKLVRPGRVYLCNRDTVLDSLAGYFDCSWGDAVVRVSLRQLDCRRLCSDDDFWRGSLLPSGEV